MWNVRTIDVVFYMFACVGALLWSIEPVEAQTDYRGVRLENGMLVFQDEAAFKQVYESLENQVDAWNAEPGEPDGGEDEPCMDDNPVLKGFEQQFGYSSVRTRYILLECEQLARGVDPADIEDHHLVDDVLGTLFNEQYQLQVGTDIYYWPKETKGYVIRNADIRALRELERGADYRRLENVEVVTFRGTCSAQFSVNASNTSTTAGFSFAGSPINGNVSFFWEFGDGTISTEQNPVHTFPQGGTYTVCLTIESVEEGEECTDRICREVSVGVAACPALFIWNETGVPGQLCFADNSLFIGDPIAWEWNFGDGSAVVTESNPCHTFPCDKTYYVTLKLTYQGGCSSQVTLPVIVDSYDCCAKKAKAKGFQHYNNLQNRIFYKQRQINFFFLRRVVAKMKNYKRKSNGKWKKQKADLKIQLLGNVYLKDEVGCACSLPFPIDSEKLAFNKKRLSFGLGIGKRFHAKYEDPWSAKYFVNQAEVLHKVTPVTCD